MPKKPRFEDTLAEVTAVDRAAWRAWLAAHHATAPGVWLVYYKKASASPSVTYPEAVREALCFGWIDSKVQSIDEERYRQIYTPRKPGSIWSRTNKQYVDELVDQGLMTAAGMEKVEAARRDGSWTFLDPIEDLIVPDDLAAAFAEDEEARRRYEALSASARKGILYWIATAKRPETRQRRIEATLAATARGESPLA